MAFFLHYVPHGDFERGIFVPFNTQLEAEMQAASDLLNHTDPEFIEQVFECPYELPKFGWMAKDVGGVPEEQIMLHFQIDRQKQGRVATRKQLISRASKHQDAMHQAHLKGVADDIEFTHRRIQEGSEFKGAVPGGAYSWWTGGTATAGASALAAATAKTVVLLLVAAVSPPSITEVNASFDGVTSSAVPVLCELVSGTAGAAGTPRSALVAAKQARGWPVSASQTTCGDTYSAEPTTQLVDRKWLVTPNGGLLLEQFPMGREPTGVITAATNAKTWSLRLTAPAIVNAHAGIEFEE